MTLIIAFFRVLLIPPSHRDIFYHLYEVYNVYLQYAIDLNILQRNSHEINLNVH